MTNCRCQGIACETEDREHFETRGLAGRPVGGRCYKRRQTNAIPITSRAPQKLNTRDPRDAHRKQRAKLRYPWAAAGTGRASIRRAKPHVSTPGPTGVEGTGGTCCGARGRWRGRAGLRGAAPSEARGADDSRAGRRPRAHPAARPPRGARPPVGPQATLESRYGDTGLSVTNVVLKFRV